MIFLRSLLMLLLATPAFAADPSVTCSVEMVRREAIAISDYTQQHPPWLYWVGVEGKTLGPWSVLDIKRRMHRGEVPTEVWVYALQGNGWDRKSQSKDFMPLPANPTLAPQEIEQTMAQLLSGCWVSDPVAETNGDVTTWIFMMFTRSSNAHWLIANQTQDRFTLSLPDIDYFSPQDDFAARLIDRNQLQLELPGMGPVTFRRM